MGHTHKNRRSIASVVVSYCVVALAIVAPVVAAPWPTYQANAEHSGYVPVAIELPFTELWSITAASGTALNPVAAADGRVFVTSALRSATSGLYVYDARDGAELWRVIYGSVFSVNPPAVADGRVYVQVCNHSSGTYLRGYDAATSTLAFQSAFSAQWEQYLAPTVVDGIVYMNGGYYGGMYAMDGNDGSQIFFRELEQYDEWTPAVDATTAYSYVGSNAPGVYAVDRATGVINYRITDNSFVWNGWSMRLAPVLDGAGSLYAIQANRLIRFDLVGRGITWQRTRNFTGQVSYANGVIYAIDSDALTAWDPTTPTLLWTWAPPTGVLKSPMIVTDSHVIVAGTSSTYAVNLNTHLPDDSYPATGSLALADGVVYIAGTNGTLTALGVGTATACAAGSIPGAIRRLNAVRTNTVDVTLSWDAEPLAVGGYSVFRVENPPDVPNAIAVGLLVDTTTADPLDNSAIDLGAVVGPPNLYLYQVAGACANGELGPL